MLVFVMLNGVFLGFNPREIDLDLKDKILKTNFIFRFRDSLFVD